LKNDTPIRINLQLLSPKLLDGLYHFSWPVPMGKIIAGKAKKRPLFDRREFGPLAGKPINFLACPYGEK
jgi:hypothetical protein